jgi:hypothetical protein
MTAELNESSTRYAWLAILVAVACCSAIGCTPAVQNITVRSPTPLSASRDKANIVVVQPGTHFGSLSILDASGELVGQIHDRSHTLIQVPAGPVRLYGVVEKQYDWADRVDGTVEAGRTYYVTVSLRWGGIAFRALNPRSADDRWSQREQFLAQTPHIQMDPQKVALAKVQLGDPTPVLKAADAYVAKLDAEQRAERKLEPSDGL